MRAPTAECSHEAWVMVLIEYPETYAVIRLSPEDEMPFWATRGRFTSITRAPGELSVICPEHSVPPTQHAERGWYLLGCDGPFSFDTVGILAELTAVLSKANIPLLAVATYDTDFILTRDQTAARVALQNAGHEVVSKGYAEGAVSKE
ncbi:MAG: ACT domain-containing protein [Rhodothermaceae bacterium]|nr:ACT domain-containing protein [Rhodothermaceae bacterium]MXX58334.1 ACT domain-containing protein [Rhodothermaceae bacterium]MYD19010.1 ACT domain-containing protein [Rhodothermaceae bacterium]MYD55404.1 ACT domain-containing protein [Rhodothermaceae bacterium]MYI43401.1 ACT domain-containing protein [Rhodothermaceae bacterium]